MNNDDLIEALRKSGHYLIKATSETFQFVNGRLDIAPDYDRARRAINLRQSASKKKRRNG